jgi:endoglucanase
VLYTFHYYDPHLYTHQGVDSDDTRFVSGLTWPATPESAAIVMTRAAALVAGRHDLSPAGRNRELAILRRRLDSVIADHYDPRQVRADFGEVAQWARSNGVPTNRILLGEFGCVISSLGLPLGPDRLDWFAAVRSAAEENGFGWAYWAYKGYGGMEFVDLSGRLHENLLAPLGLNA